MSAAGTVLLGGVGAALTADDVLAVAVGAPVALDAAALARLKKESPPPKTFVAVEHGGGSGSADAATMLGPIDSRAALAVRLLSLVTGLTKVRPAVVQFMADLLNEGIAPAVPHASSDELASALFVDACHGLGRVAPAQGAGQQQQAQSLEAALVAKGLQPPGLSVQEQHVLARGQSTSTGMACVLASACRASLAGATAVAALSSEALQADVKALEAGVLEAQASKWVGDATSQLLGLLSGSCQVSPKKGAHRGEDVAGVPQFHGALELALAGCGAAVREALAAPVLVNDKGEVACAVSPAVTAALVQVSQALLPLASMSLRRTAAMGAAVEAAARQAEAGQLPAGSARLASAAERLLPELRLQAGRADAQLFDARKATVEVGTQLVMSEEQLPSVSAALAAQVCLNALHSALALEALAALLLLRVQQGPHTGEAVAPAPAPGADGDANGAAAAGGKPAKKGKGAPVFGLGKGTQLLRGYLEDVVAGEPDGETEAEGSISMRLLAPNAPGSTDGARLDVTGALAQASQLLDPLAGRLQPTLLLLRGCVEATQARRRPKIAKGTRDLLPDQMTIREGALALVAGVFRCHGAVAIDTPVFELRETLTGKYGEDSKLIYDLADQGGEILSLRYDLTVPFARYVAMHGIGNIKRYHIGKVYRRDQPALARGRFREFYQCDFDIAGAYPAMVADAECLKVLVEILSGLPLGEFVVKVNHRRLLDAMLDIAGVPPQKFRPICSAIDKLDKEPWEAVRREMVVDKGLPGDVADRIGEFVVLAGEPLALLATLQSEGHALAVHAGSRAALEEMGLLFGYLGTMGALGALRFDLSLARGLDYYTGVIYEAVLTGGGNVGSIAAGGRYDGLVGMFSGKDIPAVGVSIGIERVFAIMEQRLRAQAAERGGLIRETQTQVLVASIGNGMQAQRMRVCSQLWAAGVKAEFGYKANPKMGDQLGHALKGGIPLMVLFGQDEVDSGALKLKNLQRETEELVPEADIVQAVRAALLTVDDGPMASGAAGSAKACDGRQ